MKKYGAPDCDGPLAESPSMDTGTILAFLEAVNLHSSIAHSHAFSQEWGKLDVGLGGI